jgi:hypothetical protein
MKIHATISYRIEGKQAVLGPDGAPNVFAIGGQVLAYHALKDLAR